MRILLVEDDVKIASFVEKGLRAAGYAVDHVADGEAGLGMALNEPYDLAIIDLMLPKLDGLSLIEQLRKKKSNTPVIILSAKDSVDDRVKGLQSGREVIRDGQRIELQPLEFSLLEYLMRNHGRVVSKTMIMEHVWDYNFDPQTNVVEARISRLRDKIDRLFSRKLIHTIRGAGYVLRETP